MSDKNKIWLSSPHMGESEQKYIAQAFAKNELSSFGANINAFEKNIESYLGEEAKVVGVSSGTAAIHLALILSGVKHGDEVICQSFTFSASANPTMYQGAIPIFVDSEIDTWNMCPIHLEKAIQDRIENGSKPKAIIVVHLYGMPAKITEIVAVAKKYEIKLIEDAAEALGSSYLGQKCGTFGDFGIVSFNGNKIISTSGGGVLICKTDTDKQQAIFLASQAKDKAIHYQHSEVGYNYRMSNVLAGMGRGQMEILDEHIVLRQEVNKFYKDLFKSIKGVSILEVPNPDFISNHWLSCILIDEKMLGHTKEDIRVQLLKDNIESRPLWKPMHLQPIFSKFKYYGNNISEELFNKGLCLPSSSNLNNSEKERIKISLQKVLGVNFIYLRCYN